MHEILQTMDSFDMVSKIAEGVYGTVLHVRHKSTGAHVALKRMDLTSKGGLPYYLLREWASMKVLRNHPRIVAFCSMILPDKANPKFCMEMELCTMNLYEYARRYEPRVRSRKRYLKQMLEALAFVHGQGILHRDIKPENILLTSTRQIKLADFGLSRFYHVPLRQYTMNVASRWWRAPELMLGEFTYGPSIDVWGVAMIFVELLTGKCPWKGTNNVDQLFQIFRDLGVPQNEDLSGLDRSMFPDWRGRPVSYLAPGLSPVGCHLLTQLLEINPHKRTTAAKALKHPYFWESTPSSTPTTTRRKRARSHSPPPRRPTLRRRYSHGDCTPVVSLPLPKKTIPERTIQLLTHDLLTPMRMRSTTTYGPVHYFERGRSVINLLFRLKEQLGLSMETVHLAFSLVGTMASRGQARDDWNEDCIGCGLIAAKMSSRQIPTPEQLAAACNVSSSCVRAAEYTCMQTLDGDFHPNTVVDYMWYYFESIPYAIRSRETRWLSFLADAMLEYVQDKQGRVYPPSMLAATGIYAYLRRGNIRGGWTGLFDSICRYAEADVAELADRVNAYVTCMYKME